MAKLKAKAVKRWIQCTDPKTKETYPLQVNAWVLPDIHGLFVNQYMERVPGKGRKLKTTKNWTITHRKSGLRFPIKYKFKSKDLALQVMSGIADFTNWNVEAHELSIGKELKEMVYDIIEEVTGERPGGWS